MTPAPPSPDIFRHRAFRGLLSGGAIYFLGNAMQVMAAAWLMVELTGSAFLAALVQTAVFLPMFLLSLPAGVLADTTDRQQLIQLSLWVQTATVALLAGLLMMGWAGPACSVTLGAGKPLLPRSIVSPALKLVSARRIGPGFAELCYEVPARPAG